MTAPDTLREAVARTLNETFKGFSFPGGRWSTGYGAEMAADAILAEHIAPRDERIAALTAERDAFAALLRPIQVYAAVAVRPEADVGEGWIGEIYHDGLRHVLRTRDLRAIRDAVLPLPRTVLTSEHDHAR